MMDEEHADEIVATARRRGLGSNPGWRRAGAVLWSAFLGACASLAAFLLAPDSLSSSPITFDRLTLVFLLAWLLSLIPALSASLLASPPHSNHDDAR